MGIITIELREYPQDEKVEIDELTSEGAGSLMEEARQLLSDLEDKFREGD